MELSSPLVPSNSNIFHRTHDLSFSSSISPFPVKTHFQKLKFRKTISNPAIFAVVDSQEKQEQLPQNSPQRLLKELSQRKQYVSPKRRVPPKRFILKPPLDDAKLAQRFLNSPQLSLKQFPLLSSCLPSMKLNNADKTWIDEYLLEAKQALGYPLEPSENYGDDNPAKQFDTLLYLAFGHPHCERTNARHVRSGHSRLGFLGQFVLEMALAEFFLQRYPRESPGPMRERVYALIGKKYLPKWVKAASLHNLIFQFDDMDKLLRKEREPPVKSVVWALFGAIYLCFGMPEVYRVLFEVFGMDPEDEECQPKLRRQLEDVDFVSAEFEGKKLTWQEVAAYKPPEDALFAHPRLFRACVPPGMHRFRGNIWDYDSRPQVMNTLGYPLQVKDRIPEITNARNIELGLGLQLAFLHPSKHKFEHPRFCFERLEYVGQKIQDLVMAERLLIKHIDAPATISRLSLCCQINMTKDVQEQGSFSAKDYHDPPPAPLIDPGELTKWSFYRALIAEFIATLLFLYITVLTVIGYKSQTDPALNLDQCGGVGILGIAWAFGGMIFVLVYCTAGISGGHINPAVTFGLFLARKVSLIRAIMYMVAQCLGAICGVGLVKAFHKSYYMRYGGGANELADGYNKGTGLGAEIIGTFVLVYTVFSATDPKRSARDSHVPVLAPLPIGFAVFMVHLATIPITGTGINPARSLGAAVIYNKAKAWDDQWIFWVGPFIGAAIAAFYHQFILRAGAIKALGSFRSTTNN